MRIYACVVIAALALAACSPASAPTTAPPAAAKTADTTTSADEASGMPSGPRAVDRAEAGRDFRITISEDKTAGLFNLRLTSLNTERDLCVGAAEWPDDRGRLEGGGDYVSVTANGEGYAMRDSGEDECGERCVRHIAPGAGIDGFIGYDQFQQQAFDGPGLRTLNFGVEPYFCDSGEVQ